MHKLRIYISDKPILMINSPGVLFGITRQRAQVGHKNINIISYKNHLGRFCLKGKQFINKDLLLHILQFLAQELVMS
jgi:hypothetical protein